MPHPDLPLVSVITINYNGLEHTLAMLGSLRAVTYPHIEVIVVDNASSEDPGAIESLYPEVILLRNPENEGFAGGNNRGMERAQGAYFLLLNNDTVVAPGFLESLVNRALSDEHIGIICPKLLYYDEPGIIQFAGYGPIGQVTGRGHGIGFNEPDRGQYDEAMRTHRVHGAAMFIPRHVVERVGLMAELYFLYYEEMDYCERVRRAGYDLWYEPASVVLHKESMSVGRQSVLKTYYMSRNRLLYLRRNVSYPTKLLTYLYYAFVAVPVNLVRYTLKREWKHLGAYVRGLVWNLSHPDVSENKMLLSGAGN